MKQRTVIIFIMVVSMMSIFAHLIAVASGGATSAQSHYGYGGGTPGYGGHPGYGGTPGYGGHYGQSKPAPIQPSEIPVPVIWNNIIEDQDPNTRGIQATIHGIAAPGLTVKLVKEQNPGQAIATTVAGTNSAWHISLDVKKLGKGSRIYAISENAYAGQESPIISSITRAHVAQIVVALAGITPNATYKGYFTDVSQDNWAWPYIEAARENGLSSGYADGTFRPDSFMTRSEFSKLLVTASKLQMNTTGTGFTDVPITSWAYSFIMSAKNAGILYGYSDGSFHPNALIGAGPILD